MSERERESVWKREREAREKQNVLVYTEYMLSSGESPHSSPVTSESIHSLKKNMALNQTKHLHPKWQVPRMDPALLLCNPFSHFSVVSKRKKKRKRIQPKKKYRFYFEKKENKETKKNQRSPTPGWSHGFAVLFVNNHNNKKQRKRVTLLISCGNLATVNIHSQGFLKKKKKKKWKRKNESIYCTVYMIVYVWILEKKKYTLTNL